MVKPTPGFYNDLNSLPWQWQLNTQVILNKVAFCISLHALPLNWLGFWFWTVLNLILAYAWQIVSWLAWPFQTRNISLFSWQFPTPWLDIQTVCLGCRLVVFVILSVDFTFFMYYLILFVDVLRTPPKRTIESFFGTVLSKQRCHPEI